jgi:hypothetical protein
MFFPFEMRFWPRRRNRKKIELVQIVMEFGLNCVRIGRKLISKKLIF